MKLNLNQFDQYVNTFNMWQNNGMLNANDISDVDYAYIIEIASAKERRRKFEEKLEKNIAKNKESSK